jgi:hypothetical protein
MSKHCGEPFVDSQLLEGTGGLEYHDHASWRRVLNNTASL